MPITRHGQKFVDEPIYVLPVTNVVRDMVHVAMNGDAPDVERKPLLTGHQRTSLKWVRYKMVNGVPVREGS